ncbi:glutamate-1-semialdehyde 2,1-aminomutase [Candidatus Poribacteria bacterium]|nr:glutamate-1-semialdehyde 2,1-aminomutase [Candidatus Poribacteria bacterium]
MPTRSQTLFQRAKALLPGGVNSPVRAFKAVGGDPRFIASARGAYLMDCDGNQLIDYIGAWGPAIVGHGHPVVVEAVRKQAEIGMSYGAPCELEVEMAEAICARVPSVEMVRMVNSGTEATMSAIRLARAATKRDLIVKFEGCYHGHGDSFLSKAGSGAATFGVPTSPGVPKGAAECTLNARFNDLESVRALFAAHPGKIAGVIVEPVVGNMGCVPPRDGFLDGLNTVCEGNGALLILDEVMTGFRVAPGGAQELYGIRPALTTMGKVIGGGLPVGAYGGRRDLMELVSPAGPMYQAGTLSGNPLGMAAGLATLRYLGGHLGIYGELDRLGAALEQEVRAHIRSRNYSACYQRAGSMATLFFTQGPVVSWDDAKDCDTARFGVYFNALLESGIHMPPAQFEAFFLSAAHTDADIARTAEAMCAALDRAFSR